MSQFLSTAIAAAARQGFGRAVAGIELQAMRMNAISPPGAGVS